MPGGAGAAGSTAAGGHKTRPYQATARAKRFASGIFLGLCSAKDLIR